MPLVFSHPVDGPQHGGAHGKPLRRKQTCDIGEEPHPVAFGDEQPVRAAQRLHPHDRLAARHAGALGTRQRLGLGAGCTGIRNGLRLARASRASALQRSHALGGEPGDELGAPVGPGRRSGSARIRLGQRPQQGERLGRVVDGRRQGRDRRGVAGVAAGRQIDEGEVLADQAHDQRAIEGHLSPAAQLDDDRVAFEAVRAHRLRAIAGEEDQLGGRRPRRGDARQRQQGDDRPPRGLAAHR